VYFDNIFNVGRMYARVLPFPVLALSWKSRSSIPRWHARQETSWIWVNSLIPLETSALSNRLSIPRTRFSILHIEQVVVAGRLMPTGTHTQGEGEREKERERRTGI